MEKQQQQQQQPPFSPTVLMLPWRQAPDDQVHIEFAMDIMVATLLVGMLIGLSHGSITAAIGTAALNLRALFRARLVVQRTGAIEALVIRLLGKIGIVGGRGFVGTRIAILK